MEGGRKTGSKRKRVTCWPNGGVSSLINYLSDRGVRRKKKTVWYNITGRLVGWYQVTEGKALGGKEGSGESKKGSEGNPEVI